MEEGGARGEERLEKGTELHGVVHPPCWRALAQLQRKDSVKVRGTIREQPYRLGLVGRHTVGPALILEFSFLIARDSQLEAEEERFASSKLRCALARLWPHLQLAKREP